MNTVSQPVAASTLTMQHIQEVYENFFAFAESKLSPSLKILSSPLLTKKELRKMCRSKKKRIKKKWLKNPKNYQVIPDIETIYILKEQYFVCHPTLQETIKSLGAIKNEQR